MEPAARGEHAFIRPVPRRAGAWWRVTKTAEQKIGVQFAVRPAQRSVHSCPRQAPLRCIVNNNTARLPGPFGGCRPRAIYRLDYTQRPARPLPGRSHGHTCHSPCWPSPTWGPSPVGPWGARPSLCPGRLPRLYRLSSLAESPPSPCCPLWDHLSFSLLLERASGPPRASKVPLSPRGPLFSPLNFTGRMWGAVVSESPPTSTS